jgi:hypothetical protein
MIVTAHYPLPTSAPKGPGCNSRPARASPLGAEVVANFGDAPYKLPDGRTVEALRTVVKNPRQ